MVRFVCSLSLSLSLSLTHTHTICYNLYVLSCIFSRPNKLSFFPKVYLQASFAAGMSGSSSKWPWALPTSCTSSPSTIAYEGPHQAKDKLYLYHVDSHYSVITSMTAFVERSYYCDNCQVGYNNLGIHVCELVCMYLLIWLVHIYLPIGLPRYVGKQQWGHAQVYWPCL